MKIVKERVMGNRKIAIIGTGFVGTTIAYSLVLRDIAREIVLIDIDERKAMGEAWDIRHGIPSMGTTDLYVGNYADCVNCDMIIITAGRNRKSGQTRLDIASENTIILKSVVNSIKRYYTRGVILVVSNPVDILVQKASEWMELPNGRVFGTGCILDTSRFVRCIADYIGLSTEVISGYLVGEHGDSQIPIWSRVTVGEIPIGEYCNEVGVLWDKNSQNDIALKTRAMGMEIIRAKGKTHYGIATCVCYLADAILNQRPTIVSVTSPLLGEYGVRGVSLSVPSLVDLSGVQQRIREKWTSGEYRNFLDAAERVRIILNELPR